MRGVGDFIAGVVVLYNPTDTVIDTISSYIQQVKLLYVVDNSTTKNPAAIQKLRELTNVIYVDQQGNKGIAAALNRGARLAIADGFRFLLTMDQDTKLKSDFISDLSQRLNEDDVDQIGIIAPRYDRLPKKKPGRFEKILFTMTSGNILNLDAFNKTGPFLEELFIDHVDHEYCLRLNQNGFKIIQMNDVEIDHRPGSITRLFFKDVLFSSHSPQRLYYFCRNGFYVANRYRKTFPAFRYRFYKLMLKEICKIPFEKNRIVRIQMLIKGYFDYKSGTFGPLGTQN